MIRKPALLFIACTLFFAACSGESPESAPESAGSVPPEYSSLHTESGTPFLLSGDVTGGREDEIILVDGNKVIILSGDGTILKEARFEIPAFISGITADINGDGKVEIILGTDKDKSARILFIDGMLNTVNEYVAYPARTQRTIPLSVTEGILFYVTHSTQHTLPKAVGAVDLGSGTELWTYDTGPVPYSAAVSDSARRVVVSNRGFAGEEYQAEINYLKPRDRHAVMMLNMETGSPDIYKEIGPPSREGFVVENGISGVYAYIDDLDEDGREELYYLLGRLSEFYPGNAELQVRSSEDGKVLRKLSGPEKTEGEIYSHFYKGRKVLLVIWKQAGICELYDSELTLLESFRFPGSYHDVGYFGSGAFLEQDDEQVLLKNNNKLYLLDDSLNPVWTNAFAGDIRHAAIIGEDAEEKTLAVAAGNRCHIFKGDWRRRWTLELFTDPAGSELHVDGSKLSPSESRLVTGYGPALKRVYAELEGARGESEEVHCTPGTHRTLTLKIPDYTADKSYFSYHLLETRRNDYELVPPPSPSTPLEQYEQYGVSAAWSSEYPIYVIGIEDFTGTGGNEILVSQPALRRSVILDSEMNIRRYLPSPEGRYKHWQIVGDYDGDGKSDLGIIRTRSPEVHHIAYRNGDGRLLFRKELFYATDTSITSMYRDRERIAAIALTGYQIQPRSFFTISPENGELDILFHRAATFHGGSFCYYDGRYYLSSYTPSNGGTFQRKDGTVEDDSEVVIHILDENGELQPGSGILEHEENSGHTFPLIFDANSDGKKEVYYFEGKNKGYYPGTPVLYRIEERKGEQTPLYKGPEDDQARKVRLVESGGKQYLAIFWKEANRIDFLDEDFSLAWRTVIPPESATPNLQLVDADSDDNTEMVGWDGRQVLIYSLDGTLLSALPFEPVSTDDQIRQLFFRDIDLNGSLEMVIGSLHGVTLYSYE